MNVLNPRHGTKRRTYTVRRKYKSEPSITVGEGLLTYEEAEAQAQVQLVDFIDAWLGDHHLMLLARDHSLRIRTIGGAGRGLVVEDHCENRPCPWFGDPGDYTGPIEGTQFLWRTWIEVVEP